MCNLQYIFIRTIANKRGGGVRSIEEKWGGARRCGEGWWGMWRCEEECRAVGKVTVVSRSGEMLGGGGEWERREVYNADEQLIKSSYIDIVKNNVNCSSC